MERKEDIQDLLQKGESPFSMPEGYLSQLEERMHELIAEPVEQKRTSFFDRFLKPAIALCCSFVVILAAGYGILRLTDTRSATGEQIDLTASIPEEYRHILKPSYFEYEMADEAEAEELTEEQILDYLESSGGNGNPLYGYLASLE